MRAAIGIAATVMTVPFSASHAQDSAPVTLEFAPEPGSTYRNEQHIEAGSQAWVGAYDDRSRTLRREHTSKTVVGSTLVLPREPDGSTTIEQRMVSLKQDVVLFNARDGESRMHFDTENPDYEATPEFRQFVEDFRAIVGTTTLAPSGEQLAYRIEPEGTPLTDTLALAQSQRSNGTVLAFPDHPVAPGDSWPVAPGTLPAAVLGLGNGRIEYPVEATLVAIEQRGGRTHALIRLKNGDATHIKDDQNAGPGISSFELDVLYEYDLQLKRQVQFRIRTVLQLFVLDLESGDILNLEDAALIRDRDPDSDAWMIAD